MNFDFLKPIESMKQFCDLCVNAEILVLDFPVQSVITSRKAMEYIVRLLYSASIDEDIRGLNMVMLLMKCVKQVLIECRSLLTV